jgi:uncharacterized protein YndB with AHSA1/START domain
MATLANQITIAAPRGAVWQALTDLDLLGQSVGPGKPLSTASVRPTV